MADHQGARRILLFDEFENAKPARNVVQHYGFTRRCFVGRTDPGMDYWLVDGEALRHRRRFCLRSAS